MKHKIGFMQGRLCARVDGKIQAFPWTNWTVEFSAAAAIDLHLIEWTLDQERLYENPLMTVDGQRKIKELCQKYDLSIPSLTGDCFMQAPFWKSQGELRAKLQNDFLAICDACAATGIRIMVVPLVDYGRLENQDQEDVLIDFLLQQQGFLNQRGLQVIFESDFPPYELVRFIARLPAPLFGINYDIGNSAALGFNPVEEISAYGNRITNVHVKDRKLAGSTVPLGTGNADFESVFFELAKEKYTGNFILQTARADNDDHGAILDQYRDMTVNWMVGSGISKH
jgi:hexulose-6-phosphate isomerase